MNYTSSSTATTSTTGGSSTPQTATAKTIKRKSAKRTGRCYIEEPLYLMPANYALLQDSTYELMRGLSNLNTPIEDEPLYFEQLLGAAVNIKHAFDLGRIDVINGTIKPRNTSLCHECITTVSSVWRSGPDGPRTLCNACGLRYYKHNQRRALEAKRKQQDSPNGFSAMDVAAAQKLFALSNSASTRPVADLKDSEFESLKKYRKMTDSSLLDSEGEGHKSHTVNNNVDYQLSDINKGDDSVHAGQQSYSPPTAAAAAAFSLPSFASLCHSAFSSPFPHPPSSSSHSTTWPSQQHSA